MYQTWLPQENQSLRHNLLHKIPTTSIFSEIDKKAYIYVNAKMIMGQNRTLPAVRVSVNMVFDTIFINISVIWWHSSCFYNLSTDKMILLHPVAVKFNILVS